MWPHIRKKSWHLWAIAVLLLTAANSCVKYLPINIEKPETLLKAFLAFTIIAIISVLIAVWYTSFFAQIGNGDIPLLSASLYVQSISIIGLTLIVFFSTSDRFGHIESLKLNLSGFVAEKNHSGSHGSPAIIFHTKNGETLRVDHRIEDNFFEFVKVGDLIEKKRGSLMCIINGEKPIKMVY